MTAQTTSNPNPTAGAVRGSIIPNDSIDQTGRKVNGQFSVDDTEYLRLAENPAQNYDRLNEMVRQAAEDAAEQRFSVDDYDYQDLSWAVNDGILSPLELRKVESAVAETVAQGYNSHSFNDTLSFASIDGTKAALFHGSIEQPVIDYVIQCDTGIDQDEILLVKEYIDYARDGEPKRILESLYDEQGIRIFDRGNRGFLEREIGGREGDIGQTSSQGYQGRENQVSNANRRYGPTQTEVDESLERMRTTIREEEEAQKFSIDDGQQERGGDANTRNGSTVRQEVKATYAKSNLRSKVQTIFSIQPGNRSIASAMLNDVADRYLRNGYITEEDRQNFFDRMVELGTVTVPDSSAFLRPYQSLTESLIHKKRRSYERRFLSFRIRQQLLQRFR